jgi:hypothetical protein
MAYDLNVDRCIAMMQSLIHIGAEKCESYPTAEGHESKRHFMEPSVVTNATADADAFTQLSYGWIYS